MRHRLAPTTTTARRLAATGALLVLTATSAAACGDDAGDTAPAEDPTSASSQPEEPAEPSETEETEESDPADAEPSAGDEPTPPGTVLEADQAAVVELPDSVGRQKVATFGLSLDSVTKQPLSKLPADSPPPGETDLYYVEQTYTLLEREPGENLNGENLLEHTLVWADDQPVQAFIVIGSEPEGCGFADFRDDDEPGRSRTSCTAFLVPKGQVVDQVGFIEQRTEYDYIDGDPIRWNVEG